MPTVAKLLSSKPKQSEDEIFKSLNHPIRRNIIKVLGINKSLSFSQILNSMENIDSPSLSYHLKSLRSSIKQNKTGYNLTKIGKSAYKLVTSIDNPHQLRKFRIQAALIGTSIGSLIFIATLLIHVFLID